MALQETRPPFADRLQRDGAFCGHGGVAQVGRAIKYDLGCTVRAERGAFGKSRQSGVFGLKKNLQTSTPKYAP